MMTADTSTHTSAPVQPAQAAVDLDILHAHAAWDGLADADDLIERALKAALAGDLADAAVEVCVLLESDDAMRALNKQWRGKDRPTNVLSFPGPDSAAAKMEGPQAVRHLGDIALGFETLMAEAEAERKTPQNHLQHLVVHGMLHLQGMDHETDADAARMEALEQTILAGLGVPDPYAA